MRTKTKYKINATAPRLSDEDIDPIEKDDPPSEVNSWMTEGWMPWDPEDLADIQRLVDEFLPAKQRFIIEAFLDGLNYKDIGVTEKYWRYHFAGAIQFIKGQLGV